MATPTTFLVNPASANGSTGRRWPELARRAAAAGLEGDSSSASAGHLGARPRGGARRAAPPSPAGTGRCTRSRTGSRGSPTHRRSRSFRGKPAGTSSGRSGSRDVERATAIALEGETRTIDAGRVTYRAWDGSEATAVFANVGSAGMSGAIAKRANETTKALGGKASYLWATFAVFSRWAGGRGRDRRRRRAANGRMFDVVVANGRFFGGGMQICPEAKPDDGLLDVLTIGDVTKRDLVQTMPKIYRGPISRTRRRSSFAA